CCMCAWNRPRKSKRPKSSISPDREAPRSRKNADLRWTPMGLANLFFHLPARLEGDHGLCRHCYPFPCAGVACWAGLALFYLEHAKVSKLDPPFLYQRVDYPVEDPLDDLLDLKLGKAHVVGDRLGHVFPGHGLFLSGH